MEINNVRISDGNQFYNKTDIIRDARLMNCYRNAIAFHPFAPLIDRINKENALLTIHVSPDLQDVIRTQLERASKELAYEFYRRYLD